MFNISKIYRRNILMLLYCFVFFVLKSFLEKKFETGNATLLYVGIEEYIVGFKFFANAIIFTALLNIYLVVSTYHLIKNRTVKPNFIIAVIFLLCPLFVCSVIILLPCFVFYIIQYFRYRNKTFISEEIFCKYEDNTKIDKKLIRIYSFFSSILMFIKLLFGMAALAFTVIYENTILFVSSEILLAALYIFATRRKNAFVNKNLELFEMQCKTDDALTLLCFFIKQENKYLNLKYYHLIFAQILLRKEYSFESVKIAYALYKDKNLNICIPALIILVESYIFTAEREKIIRYEEQYKLIKSNKASKKLIPKEAEFYFEAVFAYFYRDYDTARKTFNKLDRLYKAPSGIPNIKILYFCAVMDIDENKKDEAKGKLEKIINIDLDWRYIRMAKSLYETLS